MHNEYGPMTETLLLAFMYENEKSEIVLCELIFCL